MSRKWISSGRVLALAGLAAAVLAGCGSSFKAVAGSNVPAPAAERLGYGVVDVAPRPHAQCMRQAGLPATRIGLTTIQVGPLPGGPTVVFAADPNGAEMEQITGQAAGAEVIGAALLYVHGAPDTELAKIEGCLDMGVAG